MAPLPCVVSFSIWEGRLCRNLQVVYLYDVDFTTLIKLLTPAFKLVGHQPHVLLSSTRPDPIHRSGEQAGKNY